MRVGLGYDSHRFAEGRPLILGGQRIPFEKGLLGHSDADAVTHAVIDAVLGAAGASDIGTMFPDNESRWKDIDSLVLLRMAKDHLAALGFTPKQVDVTVILERPRLGVYRHAMAATLAGELGIETEAVSIKAKTNEGMGFIGRGEGIAVMAVATVEGP
ncbi:MAG: 2-C-methyl-D-erythritol 2,4-cyclodiphosphate synthase [Gemmatimonadota bacterium]